MPPKLPIYLDYAASTPIDPRAAQIMCEYIANEANVGNPASTHVFGQAAKQAVDLARQQVAGLIHADPAEIIWTSGATESVNLALKGAAQLYQRMGKHIVTVATEHKAVLDCCQQLEKQGYSVTYLPVASNGLLAIDTFLAALQKDTILVSVMHVNNEIGVIQDIGRMAAIAAEKNILFHVDATQSVGKLPLNLSTTPIHLLSFSAHKLYGPKGIGALYVRKKPRVRVAAQIHGGGQEQGMRSGTLATHQIIGFGAACAIATTCQSADMARIKTLHEYFLQGLRALPTVVLHGEAHSIPGIVNLRFTGILARDVLQQCPEIALATGSACSSAKGVEPSYVLRALGLSTDEAAGGIRFSFGRFTTLEEINFTLQTLARILRR